MTRKIESLLRRFGSIFLVRCLGAGLTVAFIALNGLGTRSDKDLIGPAKAQLAETC